MSNSRYTTYGSGLPFRFGETEARQIVVTDISAEMIVESTSRVQAFGRVNQQTPRLRPLPSKFRKRLAGTR